MEQTRNTTYIIRQVFFLLVVACLSACSQEQDEADRNNNGSQEVVVTTRMAVSELPLQLQYSLYVFRKEAGDAEYYFSEGLVLQETSSVLRFTNSDLVGSDYRFLLVATTAAGPEIRVTDRNDDALDSNSRWSDLLITANHELLSGDNFSGILDKTGEDILDQGAIQIELTRMVGQVVLDISRIKEDIHSPMDIVSKDVTSVLDRVFKLEVEYEGLTKAVALGPAKELSHQAVWPGKVMAVHPVACDEAYKVAIPQLDNGLELMPGGKLGSVRIKGLFCLPSAANMRFRFTFHYYDTTPVCGNQQNGNHSEACYEARTLVLNIPRDIPGASLLSVYPDCFTVNRAGIRFDRIIDLDMDSSIAFETEWRK